MAKLSLSLESERGSYLSVHHTPSRTVSILTLTYPPASVPTSRGLHPSIAKGDRESFPEQTHSKFGDK